MPTYRGKGKVSFKNQHTEYKAGDSESFSWDYSTVSDSFCLTHEQPERFCAYSGKLLEARTKQYYMGPQEAFALLEILKEFDERNI